MLTGVIYGAIVVAWATYLVPLALRRDEQATRTRSIERFSTAMRVLVRRGARVEATSQRPPDARRLTGGSVAGKATVDAPLPPELEWVLVTPRPNRAAERAAAARRRTVVYVLIGLTLLVGMVSVLGLLPWWSFVAPVTAMAGFLVIARRSVRKANAPYWVEAAPVAYSVEAAAPAGDREDDSEATITLSGAQRRAAAAPRVANGSTLWDPVPVTLPTYVDAPVARRAFRTITLGAEVPAVKDSVAPAAPVTPATDLADDTVDVVDDVPQAANG